MMKKAVSVILMAMTAAVLCTGCGGGSKSYADGTYSAQSSMYESLSDEEEDEGGEGYGEVTITVNGEIQTIDTSKLRVVMELQQYKNGVLNATVENMPAGVTHALRPPLTTGQPE